MSMMLRFIILLSYVGALYIGWLKKGVHRKPAYLSMSAFGLMLVHTILNYLIGIWLLPQLTSAEAILKHKPFVVTWGLITMGVSVLYWVLNGLAIFCGRKDLSTGVRGPIKGPVIIAILSLILTLVYSTIGDFAEKYRVAMLGGTGVDSTLLILRGISVLFDLGATICILTATYGWRYGMKQLVPEQSNHQKQ